MVVDVGAHQKCHQLPMNEGDLLLYRVGGDKSDSDTVFLVRQVPEVFSTFDDLSYDLSRMDLSRFRTNAITTEVMRR